MACRVVMSLAPHDADRAPPLRAAIVQYSDYALQTPRRASHRINN